MHVYELCVHYIRIPVPKILNILFCKIYTYSRYIFHKQKFIYNFRLTVGAAAKTEGAIRSPFDANVRFGISFVKAKFHDERNAKNFARKHTCAKIFSRSDFHSREKIRQITSMHLIGFTILSSKTQEILIGFAISISQRSRNDFNYPAKRNVSQRNIPKLAFRSSWNQAFRTELIECKWLIFSERGHKRGTGIAGPQLVNVRQFAESPSLHYGKDCILCSCSRLGVKPPCLKLYINFRSKVLSTNCRRVL